MELFYAIIGLIAYIWATAPRNKELDELISKTKRDQDEFSKENIQQSEKYYTDDEKASTPQAPDYMAILLSNDPIDDMTAYYMRQTNNKDLYLIYINESPNWRLKRNARFKIDKGICQSCGKIIYLNSFHCHHKNYNTLFNEDLDDLESLCWSCHEEKHKH